MHLFQIWRKEGEREKFPLALLGSKDYFLGAVIPLSSKIAKTKSLLPSLRKRKEFPSLEKRGQGRFWGRAFLVKYGPFSKATDGCEIRIL